MEQANPVPAFAGRVALLLAALKLALHLAAAGNYGYFRDELYFLDCARHLQWGYVDDAPGVVLAARVALLLGGSLPAVRLLAALGGAGTVFLGCLAARELGGGRFAQIDLEIDLAKTFVMRCIAKKFPVKKAVLFESYRFGDLDQNKCISIALILDPMTNPLKVMTELVRLTWEFTVCIDPYPLSVSDFESSTPTIDQVARAIVQSGISRVEICLGEETHHEFQESVRPRAGAGGLAWLDSQHSVEQTAQPGSIGHPV